MWFQVDAPGQVKLEDTARDERIRWKVGQGSSHGMYLSASYILVQDLDLSVGACFVGDRGSFTYFVLSALFPRLIPCPRKGFFLDCAR